MHVTPDDAQGPAFSPEFLKGLEALISSTKTGLVHTRNFLATCSLLALVYPDKALAIIPVILSKTPLATRTAPVPPCQPDSSAQPTTKSPPATAGTHVRTRRQAQPRPSQTAAVRSAARRRQEPRPAEALPPKPAQASAKQVSLSAGELEGHNWQQFINYSDLTAGRNLVGQRVIKGVITSAATAATYHALVIHVKCFARDGALLKEIVLPLKEVIPPGHAVHIKETFSSGAATHELRFALMEAQYTLP